MSVGLLLAPLPLRAAQQPPWEFVEVLGILTADLSITKTDGVSSVNAGGSTTYTITGSNAGPDGVSGATVADSFDAVLTCNWTCLGAGGGTCTAAGSGSITDTVNLPSGASATYTAVCSISGAASGSLVNIATITSSVVDPVPGNNSATDTDTVLSTADLSITKTDGLATATPGGSTTYTMTASNAGPLTTTATVADTFDGILTCTWTCVGAGGGTCTASGSGNINDGVNLPNGASVTYTAACTIAASATGTLANTATVTGAITDPNTGDNSATDTDTLTPEADLATSQTDDFDPIGVHRDLTYTVTVGNVGPSDAAAVSLTDALPEGATFVSSTPGSPACTESAGTVTCDLGGLAAGGASIVSVVIRTTEPGTISNIAQAGSATSDPASGNNTSTETTAVRFDKGDFNNDLYTDLFIANTSTNEHRVWSMNGVSREADTAFNPASPGAATQRVTGVDDFGGDFRNDLVFWDSASGAVEFWILNGVDRQGAPVPLTGAPALAPNWKLSATADFNADSKPDIVWRNSVSQKIVIWTMNGTVKLGSLIPTPDQAVNSNWEIVGARDLNADGFTDLLWYNPDSGKIVYWWLDGSAVRITGNFTNPANAGNNNWKVLAMGDYGLGPSGVPGTVDIVWRNEASGNFVVWHMDTAGNRTSGQFTIPTAPATNPLDWTIVGPR